MGLEQVDSKPIGIGFDRNFNNSSKIFYEDGSGFFINTTQQGTLMIRPEFGTVIVVSRQEPQIRVDIQISLFPNPIDDGKFSLISAGEKELRKLSLDLCDLQGKSVWTRHWESPSFPVTEELPVSLPDGIYFAHLSGTTYQGEPFSQTLKLINH